MGRRAAGIVAGIVLTAALQGGAQAQTTGTTPSTIPGGGGSSPGPRVTVTPSTGLSDGQVVTVAATGLIPANPAGFAPNQGYVAQCREVRYASDKCANWVSLAADTNGSFPTIQFTVRRTLQLREGFNGAPSTYTCDPSCYIVAINGSDDGQRTAYAAITFGTPSERWVDSLDLPPSQAMLLKATLKQYEAVLNPLFERLLTPRS